MGVAAALLTFLVRFFGIALDLEEREQHRWGLWSLRLIPRRATASTRPVILGAPRPVEAHPLMHTTLPDGRHVPLRSAPQEIVRQAVPILQREIAATRSELADLDSRWSRRLLERERRRELRERLAMLEAGRADAEARLRSGV